MKQRRYKINTKNALKPLSAFAAMIALGVPGANAQTSPVFNYNFPASWNGTGTTITDQSAAGNNGFLDGTLALASAVPPGAPGGTESISTVSGGILTSGNLFLNNAAVASAGGFTYDLSFMWNGTDSSSFGHTEKLIDYAGTESLQLITTATSATLEMVFSGNTNNTAAIVASSTTVLSNTWYHATMTFNTDHNSVDGTGALTGTEALYVNGSLVGSTSATKGNYGDSLDRPIGVGQLGANFGYLVGFKGDIYDPNVSLGVVPEPSATALLGAFGGLAMAWNFRRRKV